MPLFQAYYELQRRGAKGRERDGWRREWDSNPRYGFPHTRFPSVRLKPLGHPSKAENFAGNIAAGPPVTTRDHAPSRLAKSRHVIQKWTLPMRRSHLARKSYRDFGQSAASAKPAARNHTICISLS